MAGRTDGAVALAQPFPLTTPPPGQDTVSIQLTGPQEPVTQLKAAGPETLWPATWSGQKRLWGLSCQDGVHMEPGCEPPPLKLWLWVLREGHPPRPQSRRALPRAPTSDDDIPNPLAEAGSAMGGPRANPRTQELLVGLQVSRNDKTTRADRGRRYNPHPEGTSGQILVLRWPEQALQVTGTGAGDRVLLRVQSLPPAQAPGQALRASTPEAPSRL